MAGLRSPSKHKKPRVPTIRGREVGGAVQSNRKSIVQDQAVVCGLPAKLSPAKAELALWRAFLAEEIDAILRDGE
jgi:hypothetical protein